MRFRKNIQDENWITPNISGVKEKSLKGSGLWRERKWIFCQVQSTPWKKVGTNIKKARLRRNIRAEILAERAGISVDTFTSIEKGVSTVSIGSYAAVLVVLELDNDLELIAVDEEGKQWFKENTLKKRERAIKIDNGGIVDERK